jgi:hypothetical protein
MAEILPREWCGAWPRYCPGSGVAGILAEILPREWCGAWQRYCLGNGVEHDEIVFRKPSEAEVRYYQV